MGPVKVQRALVIDDRFDLVWDFAKGDFKKVLLMLRRFGPRPKNCIGNRDLVAVFCGQFFVSNLL